LATAGHIPVPYVMGYDTRPLHECLKNKVSADAADNNHYLFLEHDPQ
jgi:uncharacterized lipoprotein YbaY